MFENDNIQSMSAHPKATCIHTSDT